MNVQVGAQPWASISNHELATKQRIEVIYSKNDHIHIWGTNSKMPAFKASLDNIWWRTTPIDLIKPMPIMETTATVALVAKLPGDRSLWNALLTKCAELGASFVRIVYENEWEGYANAFPKYVCGVTDNDLRIARTVFAAYEIT